MKANLKTSIGFVFLLLSACTVNGPGQNIEPVAVPVQKIPKVPPQADTESSQNPPLTALKNGRTLRLVRIMDGGSCKDNRQGAKGVFLLYAEPTDVERIKHEQGAKVFTGFEKRLETIASTALQEAINGINFDEDPFSLGEDDAQSKLSLQLSNFFRSAVASPLDSFSKTTTLTVDVVSFPPSFIFFREGCNAKLLQSEN
ncbi:MAG: hypothetical protein WC782_00605 [Methylococcaceae bacterium]|jgi:hypothetical protein